MQVNMRMPCEQIIAHSYIKIRLLPNPKNKTEWKEKIYTHIYIYKYTKRDLHSPLKSIVCIKLIIHGIYRSPAIVREIDRMIQQLHYTNRLGGGGEGSHQPYGFLYKKKASWRRDRDETMSGISAYFSVNGNKWIPHTICQILLKKKKWKKLYTSSWEHLFPSCLKKVADAENIYKGFMLCEAKFDSGEVTVGRTSRVERGECRDVCPESETWGWDCRHSLEQTKKYILDLFV